jgi:hypothetical protein
MNRHLGLLPIPVGSIKLRRMDDLIVWQELLTVHNGRTVSGWYAVQHGMVRVKAAHGEKARRLDERLHPIWLAGRLLSELAAEEMHRKEYTTIAYSAREPDL